ncbi:MAG: hypothetical protein IPK32_17245 [Verrucomicrobiaceae bacterium]|nr:hypothetical protein [Verrucomicrobiaceae bacterium]
MNTMLETLESSLRALLLLSWKGSLLALAALLLLWLFRRRVAPAWRHALWLLVLLRFVVPDLGESRFSLNRAEEAPAVPQVAIFPETERTEPVAEMPREVTDEPVGQEILPDLAAQTDVAPEVVELPWSLWQWMSVFWLCGVLGMLGTVFGMHLRFLLRLRQAEIARPEVEEAFAHACVVAGLRRRPRLMLTDAVRTPAVAGLWRSVVLLPRDLAVEADLEALHLVFMHELAHLRRGDIWAQLAATVITALHWFNPLVWVSMRCLRLEAEQAADARALCGGDAHQTHQFGELLLRLANHTATGWLLWMGSGLNMGIAEGKTDLRKRIENLMDQARDHRARWAAGMALFMVLAVSGLTRAPAQESEKMPPTVKTEPKIPAAPKPGTVRITGRVVNENQKPIPGAKCNLSDAEMIRADVSKFIKVEPVLSDAEGRFVFEDVPAPHLYRLFAEHELHLQPKGVKIEKFNSELVQEHLIILQTANSWLTGKVTSKVDGKPIKGAQVFVVRDYTLTDALRKNMLADYRRTAARQAVTDDQGTFRVASWSSAPKTIQIIVDAPGMAYSATKLNWVEDNINTHIVLEPYDALSGIVVDSEGKPVKGAWMVLTNRFTFLGDDSFSSKEKHWLNNIWTGVPVTDEHGRFHGTALLDKGRDEWLLAVDPLLGVSKAVRFQDWKAGGTLKLVRWNKLHGILYDEKGRAVPNAKLKMMEMNHERTEEAQFSFGLSNTIETVTDSQGRYVFGRCLPYGGKCAFWVNEKISGYRHILLGEGESRELDLHMRPESSRSPPGPQTRQVTGRIDLPEGLQLKNADYKMTVSIRPEDESDNRSHTRWTGSTRGNFTSAPLEPGDYRLRISVSPTSPQLRSAPDEGLTMRFRLEADQKLSRMHLGNFTLKAADFEFSPSTPKVKPLSTPQVKKMDVNLMRAADYASWTAGGAGWTLPEAPVPVHGQLSGELQVGTSGLFAIRAMKTDGTRHFSSALRSEDRQVSLTPGVSLKGRLKNLPANYAGDGWIIAAPILEVLPSSGEAVRGTIPRMHWHTWTPVEKDGSFRFVSLPRGQVELFGFGDGWITAGENEYIVTSFRIRLTGEEAQAQVEIGTRLSLEKKLRVLLPDGTPAAGVKLRILTEPKGTVDRALGRWSCSHEPEDSEAYQHYYKTPLPGHRATTDSEGHATLRNLLSSRMNCEFAWTDPASGNEQKMQGFVDLNRGGVQEVKLLPNK